MSHLNHIIENVRTKGFHEEPWHVLNNAYFKGEDARYRVKEWANSNGMMVYFDFNAEHPLDLSVQLVSFHHFRSAK
jgi:hypothetical protein